MPAKLLVVEDMPAMRLLLVELLKNEGGHDVESCENGKAALERVKQSPDFDCVLTDIRMPEMNGLEFLKQSQKIAPQIPVIIVTGAATIDNAVEALKKGAVALIEKPFQSQKVVSTVQEILSLRGKTDRKQLAVPYLEKKWTLECPGSQTNLESLVEILTQGLLHMHVLSSTDETRLRDTLWQALDNAVKHGNGNNAKKRIVVNASSNSKKTRVSILDEGDGFNPLDYIEEGNLNEAAWKKGKGLFKIYSAVNQVVFNAKGNQITLIWEKKP